MPLFFLIAIGAGALTLGATTADVTSDMRQQERSRAQAVQTTTFQANAYATQAECLNAAAQQGVSAAACQNM
jgi:hypothetical protein